MSPTTEKSQVSDIWYKAYMGKTAICCIFTVNDVIITSLVFVHGHHMYIYMYRSV